MEYKIKDICNSFNFGVSKFYKLKQYLDNSIPEQDRTQYYYNEGRNFYITEKGFNWFKDNFNNVRTSSSYSNISNNVVIYQNQIIDMYKQRIDYLETENKRLLDIISLKEQRETAKDIKYIEDNNNLSFWDKLFLKFKK